MVFRVGELSPKSGNSLPSGSTADNRSKPMKNPLYTLILLSSLFAACGTSLENSKNHSAASQDSLASSTKDEVLPEIFYKKFKGTINGNLPITMDMTKTDSTISGTYYYDKIKVPIMFYGEFVGAGEVTLIERNEMFDETGKFEGKFTSVDTFQGTWTNPKTKKTLPFVLVETKDGVAGVSFEHFRKENCDFKNENLKKPADEIGWTDTLCSYIDMTTIKVTADNPAASDAINKSILDAMCFSGEMHYASVQEFLNSVDVNGVDYYSTQYIGVRILANDNNILSISLDFSEFAGGAHPNSGSSYYSFDLLTGNKIEIADILMAGYEMTLNEIGEPIFTELYGNEGWTFEPGHFEFNTNFAILPGGLVFLFGQYEIGPYAAGMQEVFLPFNKIDDVIKPTAISKRMYKM